MHMNTQTTDTQQKILDAAIDVFAQKGFHDTRVDEIVDVSKTSKGAVYFYFPSKQDIFLAIIDKFAGLLEDRLKSAINQEASGVERVSAALQICLKTFEQYRSLAKVFLVQAAGLGVAAWLAPRGPSTASIPRRPSPRRISSG